MPNSSRRETLYITTGNPDTLNDPALYAPGELGQVYDYNDFRYQLVQGDSGATASTPAGAILATQVLYWKDRVNYIVTNNSPAARLGQTSNAWRNEVAGIAPGNKTAGNFFLIKKAGPQVSVACDGTGAIGDSAIASATSTQCASGGGVGTATTYQKLGIMTSTPANSLVNVDLDIVDIP